MLQYKISRLDTSQQRQKLFYEKVEINEETDCWEWCATIDPNGYGKFYDGTYLAPAHRYSYRMHLGEVLPTLQIDHLCRNRKCVNPTHLEMVTAKENIRRGTQNLKGVTSKIKTHCKNGHEFTEENTVMQKNYGRYGGWSRCCRTCQRKFVIESKNRALAREYERGYQDGLAELCKRKDEVLGLTSKEQL